MPSTAPETRARTAVTRNGTRTQTGRIEARAPSGSALMASLNAGSEPASSRPTITSGMGATDAPNVFQNTIERSEAVRFW